MKTIEKGLDWIGARVEDLGDAVGNIIEGVVSDPKKLAAVAVSIAFPGAAGWIGSQIGLSGAAATIAGNTVLGTISNGGNVGEALKGALISAGASELTNTLKVQYASENIDRALTDFAAKATTDVGMATLMGKDPVAALVFGGAKAASNLVLDKALDSAGLKDSYDTLPSAAKDTINAALTASLTGKDITQASANALVNSAIRGAQGAVNLQKATERQGRNLFTPEELKAYSFDNVNYFGLPESAPIADAFVQNLSKVESITGPIDNPEIGRALAQASASFDTSGNAVKYTPLQLDENQLLGIVNNVINPFGTYGGSFAGSGGSYYGESGGESFENFDQMWGIESAPGSGTTATPEVIEPAPVPTQIETTTIPGEDGSQLIVDQDGNLVDVIPAETVPEPIPEATPEPAPAPFQGPMGPTTEDVTKRYNEEFAKYLDYLQAGQPAPPDYNVQDLGITPENWESFNKNLLDMQNQGRLPSQWQMDSEGNYTFVSDDGSTLTINDQGEIVHFTEAPMGNLPGEVPAPTPAPAPAPTPGPAPAPAPAPTPGGPQVPTPGKPTAPAAQPSLGLLGLLPLLASQKQPEQPKPFYSPTVEYVDIEDPFQIAGLNRNQNTREIEASSGGYLDELLAQFERRN